MDAISRKFFLRKENVYNLNFKVLYEGKDVTPKILENPFLTAFPELLSVDLHKEESPYSEFNHTDIPTELGVPHSDKKMEIVDESAFKDKLGLEIPTRLAQNLRCGVLKILLTETRTIQLLHLNSIILKKEDLESRRDGGLKIDAAKSLEEAVSCESQTLQNPIRDQSTITIPVIMKDNSTYVSNWDLYCSSLDKKNNPKKGSNPCRKTKMWSKFEKSSKITLDEQVSKVLKQPKFKHASIITERLLASNNFSEKHILFLEDLYKVGKHSQFKYKLEKLWAFCCETTVNRTVTSLSWNPVIEGNVAVGYGTFDFCNPSIGLMCLWSILNPCQPEQTYEFQYSVTDVKFSKERPYLIAVGCYDGSIWVVDISLSSKMIIEGYQIHHLGPVWKMDWVQYDDLISEEEVLVSVGNDGRVCKWDISNKLGCSLLLHLRYSPEKQMNPSVKESVMTGDRYLSGLSFSLDPKNSSIYYVGTEQGFLVKCSTNLHDEYKEIMMAHQGPVYSLQFSPFCSKIILTCGGDWTMRLWIKGVVEPILIIRTAMKAVMQAVWSPVHSSVIASISGNELALWDISRKMAYPLRVVSIKEDICFSTVEFTNCGDNIVAGDEEGNVHVYNLQEMPHIPYHQGKFLVDSLKSYLKSKPHHLAEMEKMESNDY